MDYASDRTARGERMQLAIDRSEGHLAERLTLDLEARSTLLDHYGSLLRSWSTSLVTLTVAFFGVFIASERYVGQSAPLALLVIIASASSLLVALSTYSVMRMVWRGRMAEHLVRVSPVRDFHENESYLFLLDKKAKENFEDETGLMYGFLTSFGDFSGAAIWMGVIGVLVFIPTLAFLLLVR
jgi:hypothetical protein